MRRKLTFIISTIALLFSLALLFIQTDKAVSEYYRTVISNTVQERVNSRIYNCCSSQSVLFNDVCEYNYAGGGGIASIVINSFALNSLRLELQGCILNELSALEAEAFYMPVGNISNIKLLSGTGPRIKIKIVPLATVSCDTINNLSSVGINQTLHSVSLDFTVRYNGAPPFASNVYEAKFSVTICEALIIGEVPNVYFS